MNSFFFQMQGTIGWDRQKNWVHMGIVARMSVVQISLGL